MLSVKSNQTLRPTVHSDRHNRSALVVERCLTLMSRMMVDVLIAAALEAHKEQAEMEHRHAVVRHKRWNLLVL
jgi:hypothetical protein